MILFDAPVLRGMIFRGRALPSCHLVSDLLGEAGQQELLAFARGIGMQDRWLQHPGTSREHFDLFGGRIERARAAGALEVDRERFVNAMRAKRASLPF